MTNYQKAVKDAKAAYFSDMISKNNHNLKVLFGVITSVFSDPSRTDPVPENEWTEKFAAHFIRRIENIQS